ncbi:MAG: alpha/beta hydrolase [Candidatus Microbacterium colombiense]|nr:MAG: alpha/beta hydrolase [Microbacterium sp.]
MPYAKTAHGVETYFETIGSGQPVLLLHGGFCSMEMMRGQAESLADRYAVSSPERPGHGRTADQEGPMSYAGGVDDTLSFMDAAGIERAHVVGFSDGAIIALLLALEHPDRIRSLVAISGNLTPAGVEEPDDDSDEPDENWERLRAEYDALSPDGAAHGEVVLEKMLTMWRAEPDIDPAALQRLTLPTMIMAGDRDVIRADHTRLIADSIPGAHLCIVPGASHMLLRERPALVNLALHEFLDEAAQR